MSVAFRVDQVEYPFPAKPQPLSEARKAELKAEIKALLKARNAVLVAHYYTDHEIQALAEETGGCVADSLEMARFGRDAGEQTLIVAGVRFMGETAKILSPEKTVLMPTLEATCSLDIGCPVKEFSEFCDQHPDHTVVVYANTSAAVKARADWVVTSSIALEIVEQGRATTSAWRISPTCSDMLLPLALPEVLPATLLTISPVTSLVFGGVM